ncbi:MAG: transposase [bacterium]|nr:transposase [bacterium]
MQAKSEKHQNYSQSLKVLKIAMSKDVPESFLGVVEVDETYLGGQKKNKNKKQLKKEVEKYGKESRSGFGTTKQPVFEWNSDRQNPRISNLEFIF